MELSNPNHCGICGIVFNNSRSLLMHVTQKHNMDAKFYYDKVKKEKNEGICPCCGNQTAYIDFTRGYSRFCSTKCSVAWQKSHAEKSEIICKECGEKFEADSKNAVAMAFARHLRADHQMTPQDYYDKYMKLEGEGVCPECGKPTAFLKMSQGYAKFCSRECTRAATQREKAANREEFKQFKEEQAQIIITEEMRQEEWKKECARRLAEFEAPERCTFNRTDFGIIGSFGTITEWL